MTISTIFTERGSEALANYDWVDFQEGTGIVKFYGHAINLSTGLTYGLDRNALYPPVSGYNNGASINPNSFKTANATQATDTKQIDLDFDTPAFVIPKLVGGTCAFNIPYGFGSTDSSAFAKMYCIVVVKKVAVGGSETDLLTITSNTLDNDAGASIDYYNDVYFLLKGTLPKTKIAVGEKIRVTVEIWTDEVTPGKTVYPVLYINPQNLAINPSLYGLNQSAGYTALTVFLPFKIDL